MNIVDKVTRTRFTLKEILSNEWNTSVMPDMSNNEVEKMYTLPSSKNKQIAQFGVASACNFSLKHNLIPSYNLHVIYYNFPEIGNLSVSGMTFQQSSKYIKSRVSSQMIGVDISVSMGRLKSISIFMAGESKIPGSYAISSLSTVTQALFVAGGITEIGSLRNIQVKRSGQIISNFDLYDLLIHGNSAGDIRLQSGDIVFVPVIDRVVFVDGAIKRPGRYEMLNDETLSDLIFMAGGFKSRAYLDQIYLEKQYMK